MKCISPPELTDEQLLRHLDQVSEVQVEMHLNKCEFCQDRAQHLSTFQDVLSRTLHRASCPSSLLIGEYHLGLLDADQAATIKSHLVTCVHCSRELASLEVYLDEMPAMFSAGPVDQIKSMIANLIDDITGDMVGGMNLGRPAPAFATRGESAEIQTYHAGDVTIAVEIQMQKPDSDHRVLLGLVITGQYQKLIAYLWQGNQLINSTPVDSGGNFIITDLSGGNYELILSGDDVVLTISGLEI